ncbi:MAG: hypothetical protein ACK4YM_08315 [Novosphingobium sp.]
MTTTILTAAGNSRRSKTIARLGAALGATTMLALVPGVAAAQSGPGLPPYDTMTDLGTLGGDYSNPFDVSDDGMVVVGEAFVSTNWEWRAYRWTPANGMEDLGTLGGNYAYAYAVSGDGKVIAGYAYTASGEGRAFRWTETGGMQDLGTLGGNYSYAEAINADGSVVVGHSNIASNSSYHAFRWTSGGMQDLGTLGGNWSYARDVSADGNVVVGQSEISGGTYRAFRWTSAGGMQNLGSLGGDYSWASAVSRDGSTVVGESQLAGNSVTNAFRWTSAGGMQNLGTLGGTWSYARAVSDDGSAIVGYAYTPSDNGHHAFRWTSSGGMQDLGTFGGTYSYAYDVSGDGKVVAGYAYLTGDSNFHAFRWTEEDGMIDLGTLGGGSSFASAVSRDGSTIVGYSQTSDGHYRSFIHRTRMIDFTNMIASFALTASDLDVVGEGQRQNLGWVLDSACQVGLGRKACLGGSTHFFRMGADDSPALMRRHDQGVMLNLGVRLSPAVTFGAGFGLFQQEDRAFSIKPDMAFHYGAWLDIAPGGPGPFGFKARLAGGGAVQRNLFERGRGLENVVVTPGRADLNTLTARATVQYGIALGKLALVPNAGVTWQRSTLDAFQENDGDFPARFGQTRWQTSYATAGADLVLPLGPDTRVSLGGKADFDLDSDPVIMTGTSTIPGMETFSVPSLYPRKDTRGRFELGVEHGSDKMSLRATVGLHTPVLGDEPVVVFGIGFGMGL